MELHGSQEAEAAAVQTSLALSTSSHAGLELTMPSTHPPLPPSSLSRLGSLMTEALTKVAALKVGSRAVTEPDFVHIAELYCQDAPQLHGSKAAMAQVAGVNPAKLEPTLALLTSR